MSKKEWKILVVDDEPDVLEITSMILEDIEYDGGALTILTAQSAKEACALMQEQKGIALAFVDVVMETEHAGLDFIKYVRNELQNKDVRLIVRTGNPGQAPFRDVVRHLEIDDYKEKTDLSADKLETSVLTSLRAYKNLVQRRRLEESLKDLVQVQQLLQNVNTQEPFYESVLQVLSGFLKKHLSQASLQSVFLQQGPKGVKVLAKEGLAQWSGAISEAPVGWSVGADKKSVTFWMHQFGGKHYVIGVQLGEELSAEVLEVLNTVGHQLMTVVKTLLLQHHLVSAQSEVLNRLCGSVESKSKETGAHIRRVALYSEKLAVLCGLAPEHQRLIKEAAPMHDIGKVGIPDHILQKPGPLDESEWEQMRRHPKIGYDLLVHEDFEVMNCGAIISYAHHEKWDGSGYPQGLQGEAIPIEGRIVAIADVFDALLSKRVYKAAWTLDQVGTLFKEQAGRHFDPHLVQLLLEHLEAFHQIFLQNKD